MAKPGYSLAERHTLQGTSQMLPPPLPTASIDTGLIDDGQRKKITSLPFEMVDSSPLLVYDKRPQDLPYTLTCITEMRPEPEQVQRRALLFSDAEGGGCTPIYRAEESLTQTFPQRLLASWSEATRREGKWRAQSQGLALLDPHHLPAVSHRS